METIIAYRMFAKGFESLEQFNQFSDWFFNYEDDNDAITESYPHSLAIDYDINKGTIIVEVGSVIIDFMEQAKAKFIELGIDASGIVGNIKNWEEK